MNYDDLLREQTKLGFERFIDFIREDKNLLYDIDGIEDDEIEDDEIEDDEIEVNVEIFDDDMGTELIGTYIFNNNGDFIREV